MVIILKLGFWKTRPYHRIMFGCAINVSILSINTLWGSLALPRETGMMGAIGNTATCSASGFIQYWFIYVTPIYYDSLSLLSFLTLKRRLGPAVSSSSPSSGNSNNDGGGDTNSDRRGSGSSTAGSPPWLEKLIHVTAILIPLLMACYLLARNAYNPGVWRCTIASSPFGCGDQSKKFYSEIGNVPCERGPQNISLLLAIFITSPIVLILFVPFILLCSLYWSIRKMGKRSLATKVFKQSLVYMLLLLLTYAFRFLSIIMTVGKGNFNFTLNLLANINENLLGLWLFVAYLNFRSKDGPRTNGTAGTNNNQEDQQRTTARSSSKSSTSHTRMPMRYSYKADFSIFDGADIPTDSPWGAFLSGGVDDDYSESEDVEITQAALSMRRHNFDEAPTSSAATAEENGPRRRSSHHLALAEEGEDSNATNTEAEFISAAATRRFS
mmetsp:Transcript_24449/g.36930  ORF Transcript_24449/g.36930 Transcript_24449/m.36930 type:complete len:440 (-) Transcript_24449:131-1450(-)